MSDKHAIEREPMPTNGKISVLPMVIKDLKSRDMIGRKKYGTTLQTKNGRDALVDAYQEALDLVMYLKQTLMERYCLCEHPEPSSCTRYTVECEMCEKPIKE